MKSSTNDLNVLGSVLRAFREAMGISQEKLAEKASLHRTYIGSVERGERNPSFNSLNRILKSLNISWSDFGANLDAELMKKEN
jgi:transcriptional regulator with XRE-family HTH domain